MTFSNVRTCAGRWRNLAGPTKKTQRAALSPETFSFEYSQWHLKFKFQHARLCRQMAKPGGAHQEDAAGRAVAEPALRGPRDNRAAADVQGATTKVPRPNGWRGSALRCKSAQLAAMLILMSLRVLILMLQIYRASLWRADLHDQATLQGQARLNSDA